MEGKKGAGTDPEQAQKQRLPERGLSLSLQPGPWPAAGQPGSLGWPGACAERCVDECGNRAVGWLSQVGLYIQAVICTKSPG